MRGILGGMGAVALLVLAGFWATLYSVDAGERGVLLTGGAISIASVEPGWHSKMPWQSVQHLPMRQVTTTYDNEAFYSNDQQSATAKLSITWEPVAAAAGDIYQQFGSLEAIEKRIIAPRVKKEFKEVMGQFSAKTAIQEREKMGIAVEKAVSIESKLFVIRSVQVENIDFSDAYEDAIEKNMLALVGTTTATQQVLTQKQLAEQAVAKAKGEADSKLAIATAEAEGVRLKGEADAAAIKSRGLAEAAGLEAKSKLLNANPLLVEQTKAEKWGGVLPTHMIPNGAVPFIDAGK